MDESTQSIIPASQIINRIFVMRGKKVMFDSDLAELYAVPTGRLNEAVRRNHKRFPEEFMFQLTTEELENWKSQIAISNPEAKMGLRKRPHVFTEQGVAMLASVLRSDRAVGISILIIKSFVQMCELLETNSVLREKLDRMERQLGEHSGKISEVYAVLRKLLTEPVPPKNPMGFGTGKGK